MQNDIVGMISDFAQVWRKHHNELDTGGIIAVPTKRRVGLD